MNKYQAINKEAKKLKSEYKKNGIAAITSVFNKEKAAPKLESMLESIVVFSAYQIILNRDIYNMDEDRLNEVLNKLNVNPEEFHKKIDIYNSMAYVTINRYIDYLIEIKDVTDVEQKFDVMEKLSNDNSSFAEMAKALIDPGMYNISNERIAQIDDIVQTIYDSNIKDKITSEKSKDSELIKSAYNIIGK